MSWLEWARLISSIPQRWKEYLRGENDGNPNSKARDTFKVLSKSKNVSRQTYNMIIYEETAVHRYYIRWIDAGLKDLEYNWYMESFGRIYKCTGITKFRDFQYRLLLGKIILNDKLYDWKVKDSNRCTFCLNKAESLIHFFWECEQAKEIVNICTDMCSINEIRIEMNVYNWIFNRLHNNSCHIINFISILLKQYLYRCRCMGKNPSKIGILKEIESLFKVETANAKLNNGYTKHCKRWSPLTI